MAPWYSTLQLRDTALVLGMTGSGKTWQLDRLISYRRARALPTVVLDFPYGEHLGPMSCREQLTWRQVAERPRLVTDSEALSLSVTVPERSELADALRVLTLVCQARWVRRGQQGEPVVLVVEEAGQLQGTDRQLLQDLATQHRHWGIVPVFAAQFAIQVDIAVRRQSSLLVLMHQEWPDDIDALRKWIGDDMAELSKTLDVGDRIIWRSFKGARLYRAEVKTE